MDWLDLSTAVLAVIAAVASLMFPIQRGRLDADESHDDYDGREGHERRRPSRR